MKSKGNILIIDDEPNILKTLTIGLEAIGFCVNGFCNPLDALEKLSEKDYDIGFVDLMMQPLDGIQVLREIIKKSPQTTVVIITAHGTIDTAIEAIKVGAYDYLQKPFDLKELQVFTEKVFEHHLLRKEVRALRSEIAASSAITEIVTRNQVMRQQLDLARQVADSLLTVLIEGESGTGKDLVAEYIHKVSSRREKPFIKVNCTALAESLLESELFGHAKGAFTGAFKDRQGRFEIADGGTIFLDEIGEIHPSIQVKLLRFLESHEFERVGENLTRKVDVRVIAATNRNLLESLQNKTIREDLYYRINAVRITLPPLRQRPEDILALVTYFLRKYSKGSVTPEISPEAITLLTKYRWPGNVRELENAIERALLLSNYTVIQPIHLPTELQVSDTDIAGLLSLEEVERQHISRVLRVSKDLEEASRVLEIDPATLWRKRKKYGL